MAPPLKIILICSLCLLLSCSVHQSPDIPEHVKALDNLTIHSRDTRPASDITLMKETEYGDTEEVVLGPIIRDMEVDDEGRIWVATISEDDSSFLWWVLGRGGNVLGRFVLPGKRSERAPYEKPLIMIKRGYFYAHERDFRTGIERIVKYRIGFNYD